MCTVLNEYMTVADSYQCKAPSSKKSNAVAIGVGVGVGGAVVITAAYLVLNKGKTAKAAGPSSIVL